MRVDSPSEKPSLGSSVKHFNNFSPKFRGPATSNTLLELSK